MQNPRFMISCISLVAAIGFSVAATAQEAPPVSLYKTMSEVNKASGWVAFRNFDGKQWVYFTPLVTMHCGLKEIRYSINSDALDQKFALPECNPALPFSLPADSGPEDIALTLPEGSAQTVSTQIVFTDETTSEMVKFAPCENGGDSTCATLIDG